MKVAKLAGWTTATLIASCGTLVAQDGVAKFYKGKEMRVLVGSSAGGGYDAYARVVAKHLGRFLPGNPSLTVQNMPGAGGLRAANYLYNVAKKDGSVIAHLQRTAPAHQIMGRPGAKYDPKKFNWLGSLNSEVTICVARKDAKVQNAKDLFNKQLIVGGAGLATDSETVPTILSNILGMRFKIISGYPGSTQTAFAIDKNEIEGICGSYSSLTSAQKRWFKKGAEKVNILVQISTKKHPKIPNVPLAVDLVKSDEDRKIMELNDARLEMGRPFVAPPNVPKERVAALRKAFWDMANDKKFADSILRLGRELNPVRGKDVQGLVNRIASIDKSLVAKLKQALVYKGPKAKVVIKLQTFVGKVTKLKNGNRRVSITTKGGKAIKAKVSGSRTKITVAGKKVKRKAIKMGMTCTIKSPGTGTEAKTIDCK